MDTRLTRRNLLKFAGGSVAGLLLTPAPWKSIGDVAIWTQNWSWIPKPPRGPIKTRFTTCSICPAGCGLRTRCVGDQPVSIAGVAGHPSSQGAVCPVGLSAHHLPYHPARLVQPVRQDRNLHRRPVSLDEALSSIGGVISKLQQPGASEAVAIFDQRPGRVTSLVFRQFLAGLHNGVYLTMPRDRTAANSLDELTDEPIGPLGIDLENCRTILSFGVPLYEGWGSPGRMMRLRHGDGTGAKGKGIRIIQAETRYSTTASFADFWLPLKPGTEAALALGLAHVLVNEKLIDLESLRRDASDFDIQGGASYLTLLQRFTPENTAEVTGIEIEKLRTTARMLAANQPSVAIAGYDPAGGSLGHEEEVAIWSLNLLLGSIGRAGGFRPRKLLPDPQIAGGRVPAPVTDFSATPDHSIRMLILDAAESGNSFPWALLAKKLVRQDPVVVSFSPYAAGLADHADWIVPAPAFMETYEEVLPAADAMACSYGLTAALLIPPPGATEVTSFIQRLAVAAETPIPGEAGTLKSVELLKRRVEAIHKAGKGDLFRCGAGARSDMSAVESPDAFWKALSEGGLWIDKEPGDRRMRSFALMGKDAMGPKRLAGLEIGRLVSDPRTDGDFPLILMPTGWRAMAGTAQLSPVMTKIFGESGLGTASGRASLNPVTALAHGLSPDGQAVIESASGSIRVQIRFDEAVMPGVIEAEVGPEPRGLNLAMDTNQQSILSLCRLEDDLTWRVTRARVRKA